MDRLWKFGRGMQVAYVPTHADGDLLHPDVEFGFVTSVRSDTVFCRYWSKYELGELRTKANSEGCSPSLLVPYESYPRAEVSAKLREIEDGER